MYNELIFLCYTVLVAAATFGALLLSYEALVALVCIEVILMNFFVTKEILFFGFVATAADVLGIGAALALNMIQEYFGVARARRAMWLGFAAALISMIFSLLHCAYIPAPADVTQAHFVALLTPMPRIIIASLFSFIFTQTIDRHLYAALQRVWHDGYFMTRNQISLMITQLFDTVLFSLLGLYGLISNLVSVMIISYCIKLIAVLIAVACVGLARIFIPRINNP